MANISRALTNRIYSPSINHDFINNFINYNSYSNIGFCVVSSIQFAIAGRRREARICELSTIAFLFLEQMTSNDHQDQITQAISFFGGSAFALMCPILIRRFEHWHR